MIDNGDVNRVHCFGANIYYYYYNTSKEIIFT